MPKTIFGTTEKSNFILNMKYETVSKWINGLLCACIIVPLLGGMFITFVTKASSFLGSFLYATGFSCILFFIVQLLRKDISLKSYPAAFIIFGMALLAAYMMKNGGKTLGKWLAEDVFAAMEGLKVQPEEKGVEGFAAYMKRYQAGLGAERNLGEVD